MIKIIIWGLITVIVITLSTKSTFASTIKINEFSSSGSTSANPDWVEIYKEDIDISLYQLTDAANNKKDLSGATCNGNFCTIDWYNTLNNSGDTIKLILKSSGQSVDQVIYGSGGDISAPSSGQSAGRNLDGTGGWIIFSTPTKGSTNNTSTSNSTSTSTSTPAPTPSSSSSSSSSSNSQTSSFTISNVPSQINSDQSFTRSVNLSLPDNPNTPFYIKGAFKKSDSSNYFGYTKVSGNWVKNGASFTDQFPITTDSSGNWSGNLEVQPDSSDSGYTGTDDYIFKVGRYTLSGSGPNWSNESTINISAVTTNSDQDKTPSTVKSTSSNKSTALSSTAPQSQAIVSNPTSAPKFNYRIASVAAATAAATPSASLEVKGNKQINFLPWVGGLLVISGISSLIFIYLRSRKTI